MESKAAPVQAKKPKVARKSSAKKPGSHHPKYMDMVKEAIKNLKERQGSSRQAILKYILSHYSLGKDQKTVNTHLKLALKRGAIGGILKHTKGTGATGSFSVADIQTTLKTAKPKVKKPASVTASSTPKVKKSAPKRKPKAKKTTKPKTTKPKAQKKTKKPASKSPKKPRKPKAKKGGKK